MKNIIEMVLTEKLLGKRYMNSQTPLQQNQ